MENQLLKNKNVLIFGAKGALGKQVTQTIKNSGANIYLSDSNVADDLEKSQLGDIRKLNTLDESQIADYFQWFIDNKVKIDVVINLCSSNHSEFKHGEPSVMLNSEQFLTAFKTHTVPQFLTAKAAFGIMSQQKSGVIIFITSTLAKVGAPFSASLTASHAATEGLVKSLANEFGQFGIRVIGVRSGAMIDTPTIDYTFETLGKTIGIPKEKVIEMVAGERTSLKRTTTTKETANVIAFAASDLASYMSGTIINQSGGEILE
jgi:NAD(P)-dependent dehydrogenase (short-subunit alcohol dehydrogenase family)